MELEKRREEKRREEKRREEKRREEKRREDNTDKDSEFIMTNIEELRIFLRDLVVQYVETVRDSERHNAFYDYYQELTANINYIKSNYQLHYIE